MEEQEVKNSIDALADLQERLSDIQERRTLLA